MEAIILAGGLGTRLRSRLSGVPKPMADIAGRPFLAILLDRLADSGMSRVLLSVGYLSDAIVNYCGTSWRDMEIAYVTEETPLGTGGAIRRALTHAQSDSVLILNGDTWLELDYRAMMDFHNRNHATITLALTWVGDRARYGGVNVDHGRVTGFLEKGAEGPGWINGGVYAIRRDFPWPDNLQPKFSFETDVLFAHLPQLPHATFETTGYFLDIGAPEDLDRAQTELRRPNSIVHVDT